MRERSNEVFCVHKHDACEDDTILLMPPFILCFDYIINKTVYLYENQKYFENFKIYIVPCNRVCYNLNCNIVFGGKNMARSYDRLKKLMIDKKITNTQLRQTTKITTNAMAKIWRDEPVSIETLEKICYALNCNIEDIVEVIPEK